MVISNHHIHNVLRAFSRQLSKRRRWQDKTGDVKRKGSDCISISPRSRRKAVIEKVTSDIVDRIIRKSPRDDSPHEICGQDEGLGGNGHPLKKEDSQLSFKLIDKEEGEVTKSISIEDSEFLKDQLEEDTRTKTGN